MARYCSAQDNVRTRQSPPYRETIRVNVLHGRKSMSWAKSVLPLFTGTSSETFRKVPDRVQIDTTLNRQNRVQNHPFIGRQGLLNRTAVRALLYSLEKNRDIKEILANITAGNIRAVVEFVRRFIGSPNVEAEKIVSIHGKSGNYTIPLHEFSKAAILGDYTHFVPESSLAMNLYDLESP